MNLSNPYMSREEALFTLPFLSTHVQFAMSRLSGVLLLLLSIEVLLPPFVQAKTISALGKSLRQINPSLDYNYERRLSKFDQLVDCLFENSDVNQDDRISFHECHLLVLKLYVFINRQAPVPPPTRESLQRLFENCNSNKGDYMTKIEFTDLCHVLGKRAAVRLVACKLARVVGAPVLTEWTMQRMANVQWPRQAARSMIPKCFHPKLLPVILSPNFARSILLVAFLGSLGNATVAIVNYGLRQSLPGQEESYCIDRRAQWASSR